MIGDDDDGDDDDDDDDYGDGDDGDMIHIADVLCKEVTFHLGSNFKLDRGGIANNIGTRDDFQWCKGDPDEKEES